MNTTTRLDRLAIMMTGVCLLHCLLAPVLLTLAPIFTLSTLVEDLVFHQMMLFVVVPTSLISLFIGCKKHRNWPIAISGIVGIAILFIVAFFGHDALTSFQEKLATTFGGLMIAVSHYLNFRACQQLTCDSAKCTTEHHH